jgi:transposase
MTIIHLCAVAWSLYDACRWRALDKHRATCGECWRKEAE